MGAAGAGAGGFRRPPKGGRFSGSTAKAYGTAILGSPFWRAGIEVAGAYIGSFDTQNGVCHKFRCLHPSKLTVYVDEYGRVQAEGSEGVKAKEIDQFSIGSLAGFEMALDDMRAQGFTGFKIHDRVWIKCSETVPSQQPGYSDMVMFEISVE